MKYHLDRTIHFATEQEFSSLYRWSLQEHSSAGQPVDTKKISWWWSLYFTGINMTLHHTIDVQGDANSKATSTSSERIEITLVPEQRRYGTTSYSMFGTDRIIRNFTLAVRSTETEPSCTAWGFPSYTTEADESFPKDTTPDTVGFELAVSEHEFALLRIAAQRGNGDHSILFSASRVYGFYADWSPGITTSEVKVLACDEQVVVVPEGVGALPRLGIIGEGRLHVRRLSDLGSSHQSSEKQQLEERLETNAKQPPPRAQDLNESTERILASVSTLQKAVARLRLPIWLLLFAAIAILLSHAK
ncbi:MAG: hypothetical protein ABL907_15020 [Hyphomicrobium sp.]